MLQLPDKVPCINYCFVMNFTCLVIFSQQIQFDWFLKLILAFSFIETFNILLYLAFSLLELKLSHWWQFYVELMNQPFERKLCIIICCKLFEYVQVLNSKLIAM